MPSAGWRGNACSAWECSTEQQGGAAWRSSKVSSAWECSVEQQQGGGSVEKQRCRVQRGAAATPSAARSSSKAECSAEQQQSRVQRGAAASSSSTRRSSKAG